MLDIRPALSSFAVFERTATVTPAGGVAVQADVQWRQEPAAPAGMALGAGVASELGTRQIAMVRRDQVPVLPVDSTIVGGPAHRQKTWSVTSVDDADPDYHKAVVV